jgi:hypothetical protein
MRCPTCRNNLIRDGVDDIALLTKRLVMNKATSEIVAVCPQCRTLVPLPVALAKSLAKALLLEVKP